MARRYLPEVITFLSKLFFLAAPVNAPIESKDLPSCLTCWKKIYIITILLLFTL